MPEPNPERPFEEVRDKEGFEEVAKPQAFEEANTSGLRLKYRVGSAEDIWSVVNIRFLADDGNHYGVAVYLSGEEGPADERLLTLPLRHFCLTGVTCGEVTSPRAP